MGNKQLPKDENIYETACPILYAMEIIGQKWKLPILWYIADAEKQTLRYRELERKVVGITATMLTKCLRELEHDKLLKRKQYNTIPPAVEYSLTERGKTLMPALESVYNWAESQMKNK
ncbi:MAG: helix-turn-helix transcriptional regulator [Synergistaceae bacterium]|nr:helix-turn-helix transcriptional regulator [Synergistaceae bacterium]MBR1602291.1 helix-turn-helix transcriptional regulator [Synergistaceae bacterium]